MDAKNPVVDFWNRDLERDAHGLFVHPEDAPHLPARLPDGVRDGMAHHLPQPFAGPLARAKIVLLALNPALRGKHLDMLASDRWRRWHRQQMSGIVPYGDGGRDRALDGTPWLTSRLAFLEQHGIADAMEHACYLNRYAYASPTGSDARRALGALPSSRLVRQWAHDDLFPRARRGEVVVLVGRSHGEWGLAPGRSEGVALFSDVCIPRGGWVLVEARPRVAGAVRGLLGR